MSRLLIRHLHIFVVLVIVGLTTILFGVHLAVAAINIRVSLEPTPGADNKNRNVFDLIAEPGTVIEDTAIIRNASAETVKAYFFPSGYGVDESGVILVPPPADTPPDPGTWIVVEKQEVIIPAGGMARINFKVNVPLGLDVGEHSAILYTQGQTMGSQRTGGTGVSVVVRNGVRVYMTVPGQIDRTLLVKRISHRIRPWWQVANRKLYFAFKFDNKGNITLRPKGNVVVRGWFGAVGEMKDVDFAKIGRESTATNEVLWYKKAPIFGRFVADFEMHLGEATQVNEDRTRTLLPDKVITQRYVFWIIPWIYLLYLLLLVFILYLLRSIFIYLVIVNRLRVKTDIYEVKTGDTLVKIAAKLGVDPTILAKFNFLAWPYQLQTGDQLLVPTGHMDKPEWRSRIRGLLTNKEFLGGIVGHLFHLKVVKRISHRLESHSSNTGKSAQSPASKYEILIVEKGDTIKDIADFAGMSISAIAKLNHLKSPYRLRTGQELKVLRQSPKLKRRR